MSILTLITFNLNFTLKFRLSAIVLIIDTFCGMN